MDQFIDFKIARDIDLNNTIPFVINVIDMKESFGDFLLCVWIRLLVIFGLLHEEDR